MKNIIGYIQKAATGKIVLIFLIPAMIVYFIMLGYTIPGIEQYASGMKIFDLSPTGYSFDYAVELLNTLGEKGRALYLTQQLPLDFIYPGLFAISCSLLLAWLFGRRFNAHSKIYFFSLLPLVAGLFDYVENILILNMLISYPAVSELNVLMASTMTVLKSGITTIFFLVLIVGILLSLRRLKKKE